MPTYIQKIRAKLGHEAFIHPAARIIIEDAAGAILLIERQDNGRLGLPAGALEEGETIEACIRREVQEETGLSLYSLTLIGISSAPARERVTYPNGDCIQYFTVEFYSRDWSGLLRVADPAEVKKAAFFPAEFQTHLPPNEQSAFESLRHFRATGQPRLA